MRQSDGALATSLSVETPYDSLLPNYPKLIKSEFFLHVEGGGSCPCNGVGLQFAFYAVTHDGDAVPAAVSEQTEVLTDLPFFTCERRMPLRDRHTSVWLRV